MDGNVSPGASRRTGILLAAGLTAVLVLWFGRACLPGWWMASAATSSDTYMLSTIWERWAAQVKGGHLPLWFPEFAGGGHPVHAAWMYGLFYPPLLLFVVLPPETAWTWLAIAHLVFGAAGMYRFLRADGRDEAAAASGAVVFALSHFMIGRLAAGHLNLVMPFAWVPWTLLAVRRLGHGEPGAAGRLALCASMGLLAGHVQIWFYAAPVVAAWAVMEARAAGRMRQAWKPLVTAAALTLGVTAIQWVPAWELFSVSGHPPEDARVVEMCSAPASALVAQLAPRLWTSDEPLVHEFSGLGGPLAVAAVFFAFGLRDRRRWFWFGVLALGLVLAMGLRNPVSELANELPPFRFARAPGRAMTLVVLAGSVLAAYAVADVVPAAARWRMAVPAAFVASALAVGVPWIGVVRSDFHDFDWTKALPAEAAGHRVNVVGKRYPYLERFGVGTLRDVCPLDTPDYKSIVRQRDPAIAWWFDLGAEIEVPWDGPPADLAATRALAERSGVRTFQGAASAWLSRGQAEFADEPDLTRRIRAGERIGILGDYTGARAEDCEQSTRCVVADAPVILVRRSAAEFGCDVDPRSDSWLVVAEKAYPGWVAEVDRTPVAIEEANFAYQAVEVSRGRHEVRFAYRPWWLAPAAAASLLSLLAAVLIVVRVRRPR
jgi:hypothetical protein